MTALYLQTRKLSFLCEFSQSRRSSTWQFSSIKEDHSELFDMKNDIIKPPGKWIEKKLSQ